MQDLGEWDTDAPTEAAWRTEVLNRLPAFHIESHEVRSPSYTNHINQSAWHQDCGGMVQWMLVWASASPTEVKGYETKAKHIYLFHNPTNYHRTPAGAKQRWFCRATGNVG
jgi:hypothetical protein